jgi:hypothetical protein
MQYYQQTPEGKDPQLWDLARRRASFKSHFTTYAIMSLFFWVLWYFTGGPRYNDGLPWPVWPMLGWGIGVAFHYAAAHVTPRSNSVDKEYEKLIEKQSKQ